MSGASPDTPANTDPRNASAITLPYAADAAGAARAYLRRQANLLHPPMLDDALILTSELVTNAIRHGRPAVTLAIHLEPSALTVVVTDTGPERPPLVPRSPHPDSPTGRGLVIVDAFSHPLGDHPAIRQPRQGRVVRPRPAPAATATRLTSQRRTAITELAARSARQLGGHPSLPRLERRPITRLREKSSDPTERTGSCDAHSTLSAGSRCFR